MQETYRIQMMGLTVLFLWVPVHIGVKGNEMSDKVAKEVTKSSNNDLIVSISRAEVKSIIKKRSKERWEREEAKKGQWFHRIQRKVEEMRYEEGIVRTR